MSSNIEGISCSIFHNEIEYLIKNRGLNIKFTFLDSILHINPKKLNSILEETITLKLKENIKIILLYGDCTAYMSNFELNKNITRVFGTNCCEILLGKEKYKKLRNRGAFFLIPEWAERWQEIFEQQLGLNSKIGRSLMKEMHKELIYLDTGLVKIPKTQLQGYSEYSGLPCRVIKITLDNLFNLINKSIEELI